MNTWHEQPLSLVLGRTGREQNNESSRKERKSNILGSEERAEQWMRQGKGEWRGTGENDKVYFVVHLSKRLTPTGLDFEHLSF